MLSLVLTSLVLIMISDRLANLLAVDGLSRTSFQSM